MVPSRIVMAKATAAAASNAKNINTNTNTNAILTKQLYILRHGQATHNPRAESARAKGCSHEEFLDWMRQDDSLDSELTALGRSQAKAVFESLSKTKNNDGKKIQLVVSSPLSRAIQTADGAVPDGVPQRICVEQFREINGWLLNAQRRTKTDLKARFPSWDLNTAMATEEDVLWTPELETHADCAERGYQGLTWILDRPEDSIFLVCHGGILRFTMNDHDLVKVVDGRSKTVEQQEEVTARFGNCELRRYSIAWESSTGNDSSDVKRRTIVLTELDQA